MYLYWSTFFVILLLVYGRRRTQNMTNNYVKKLSYMSSPIVQNKVLNIGCYLLTNLKEVNFFHE
jgi:hypothetical protein